MSIETAIKCAVSAAYKCVASNALLDIERTQVSTAIVTFWNRALIIDSSSTASSYILGRDMESTGVEELADLVDAVERKSASNREKNRVGTKCWNKDDDVDSPDSKPATGHVAE